jgi:excisionase family DNA binding protein
MAPEVEAEVTEATPTETGEAAVRDYVTVVELANRLGTNRRTIYRWIREGKMAADTNEKSEFKISFEEADRIVAEWDMEKKRLKKEPKNKPAAKGEVAPAADLEEAEVVEAEVE